MLSHAKKSVGKGLVGQEGESIGIGIVRSEVDGTCRATVAVTLISRPFDIKLRRMVRVANCLIGYGRYLGRKKWDRQDVVFHCGHLARVVQNGGFF
jgi:hypothetical protein